MSDKKKSKQTLVGVGVPSADEIAADAEAKAAEATASAEAMKQDVEEEAASVGAELEEGAVDPQEKAAKDSSRSDDDTRAATVSAKKKERDSKAPPADSTKAASTKADSTKADSKQADSKQAASKQDSKDGLSQAALDKKRAAAEGMTPAPEPSLPAAAEPSQADLDKKRADAEGMAPVKPPASDSDEPDEERRPALYLAEYETPEALHKAACLVRDEGFQNWDCHTPYPVHGLDEAMGLPPTKIGIISFIHALIGLTTAVLMIQFMNNWDYPIIVGGKPAGAFAPMVPIMFELTVLLTGFGTLFGLLHLAGLPRHHHPIFESDRFASSTDDKFFISIEVKDPNFDLNKTRELLEGTSPSHLELVEEDLV